MCSYATQQRREEKTFTIVVHLLNKDLNNTFSDLTFVIKCIKLNKLSGLPELSSEKILHGRNTLGTLEDTVNISWF